VLYLSLLAALLDIQKGTRRHNHTLMHTDTDTDTDTDIDTDRSDFSTHLSVHALCNSERIRKYMKK